MPLRLLCYRRFEPQPNNPSLQIPTGHLRGLGCQESVYSLGPNAHAPDRRWRRNGADQSHRQVLGQAGEALAALYRIR